MESYEQRCVQRKYEMTIDSTQFLSGLIALEVITLPFIASTVAARLRTRGKIVKRSLSANYGFVRAGRPLKIAFYFDTME